jgi:hypothetical protein
VRQSPTYPGAGVPDGAEPPQGAFPPPPWAPDSTPWSSSPGPWWPQPSAPSPRRALGRTAVVGIAAACVLAVVVLGGVITGAVALGRAAAESMAGQPAAPLEISAPLDAGGLGEDQGLNGYAARCHDGDMQACDDLYDLSDPMSRYEQYGMTCGGRVKALDIDFCTDLD